MLVLGVAMCAGSCVAIRTLKSHPDVGVDAERTSIRDDEILAWIADITRLGRRNPGDEGGRRAREYIAAKLKSFGLRVAQPETFDVDTFSVGSWSFQIEDPGEGLTWTVPCAPIWFSEPTGEDGLRAELFYVGDGADLEDVDLSGRIAVFDQPARSLPTRVLPHLFFTHDPDDTLADEPRILAQDIHFERRIYEKARARGAVATVGLLGRLQWDSDGFVPQMNDGLRKEIPGVWVRPSRVARVRELATRGGVMATIRMRSTLGGGTGANLWAELPGRSDERYVVMGHYDSPGAGAVQDASGIAIVLALAKHFAGVRERLPLERGIVFLALDAHTIGRVGEREFVRRHRDLLEKSALVIAAEHVGRRLAPRDDLRFAVSDVPSLRLLLTSWSGAVPDLAKAAVLDSDYRRTLVVPQRVLLWLTGRARGISGEFYEAGIPVVGLLSGPPYLFFPEDTLAAVARDQLAASTDLLIALIRAAERHPLAAFR